jgi:hypothetical protein
MKKITIFAYMLLVSASLSSCVVQPQPYPYYGGSAPYYGTAVAPSYAYGEVVAGGYYPYYRSQHIYSNYNTDYWHHQHHISQGGHGFAPHTQSHQNVEHHDHHEGGDHH